MSLCGSLVTLALNATLLGHQALKVETVHAVPASNYCLGDVEPSKPNAVLSFKDANDKTVFAKDIYVDDFDFYLSKSARGGVPAKSAIVFFNYPKNAVTDRATKVELRLLVSDFKQSTSLPSPALKAPPIMMSLL